MSFDFCDSLKLEGIHKWKVIRSEREVFENVYDISFAVFKFIAEFLIIRKAKGLNQGTRVGSRSCNE